MTKTTSLCQHCKKNQAQPDHECPFAADVNNDSDTKCNCCGECAHECAMDI